MAFKIKDSDGNVKTHKGEEIYGTEDVFYHEIKKDDIDYDNRIIPVTVSSDRQDRGGDRVGQQKWITTTAKSVLYAHDYGGSVFGGSSGILPIGKIISRMVKKHDDYFVTKEKHQFPPPGKYDFADHSFNMIDFGALNATSIGFIPIQIVTPESDEEREKLGLGPYGRFFKKIEQLETSWVPVQSNRDAFREAISKGIIRDEQVEQFFPTIWKALDEMPQHWFVGEDIETNDNEVAGTSDEIIVAINSLKEAVEGLRNDIAKIETSKGIEETITTDDLDLTEVMNALNNLTDQDGDQIEQAFDQAVDNVLGRLPGHFQKAVKGVVNRRLGIIDPSKLKFRKVRRM